MIAYITHRCEESKKAGASIRLYGANSGEWQLAKGEYDFDWMTWYLRRFGPISYCPYCGQKLEADE